MQEIVTVNKIPTGDLGQTNVHIVQNKESPKKCCCDAKCCNANLNNFPDVVHL